MAQPGRGEVEGRFPIREGPDHAGPPPDLAQDAFERIVRSDAPPMLLREGVVGQRFFDRRAHELGGPGQPQRRQLLHTRTAFSRAATMSSLAWIALSDDVQSLSHI